WKMSVPTIFRAVSGKAMIITRAKNVPLPTDVRPTMKPPQKPRKKAIRRSRFVSRKGASLTCRREMTARRKRPRPPSTSATTSSPANASRGSFTERFPFGQEFDQKRQSRVRLRVVAGEHLCDLGPRELGGRQLACGEQLPHLRAGEEDVVVAAVRTRLRRGHL